jgi:hypothetical protein
VSRCHIVREDGERVVGSLVPHVVERLCEVSYHDALRRDDVNGLDHGRQVLELGLAQKFLGAHLVDAQAVADADERTAAEGRDGGGDVLDLGVGEGGASFFA